MDALRYNKAEIHNIIGQVIITHPINKNISTQQLVPGIYQLILKGDAGVKTIKIEKR